MITITKKIKNVAGSCNSCPTGENTYSMVYELMIWIDAGKNVRSGNCIRLCQKCLDELKKVIK